MELNHKYIDKMLKSCGIKLLMEDDEGNIGNPYLKEFITKQIELLLSNIDDNVNKAIEEKLKYEMIFTNIDNNAKYSFFFLSLFSSIYNYLNVKYEKNVIDISALAGIIHNALKQFQSIIFLYLSGNYVSILSQFRILYESSIEFAYINKYKNLIQAFFDHGKLMKYKILENIKELKLEEKIIKNEILRQYGEDFIDDYGWTKEIIKERNDRKLITMVKDLTLDKLSVFYKLSSNFIHPNSFSVYSGSSVDKKYVSIFINLSVDMLVNMIILYMYSINCEEKNMVILQNILVTLKQKLLNI